MIEVYLIVTGLVFVVWLRALVRQTQRGVAAEQGGGAPPRPVVPLNLRDADEAVVVAEGRGRIIYANDSARRWFGMDGGSPNLSLMSQRIQPAESLHDLMAGTGQVSFRLGQRQIEAVSHAIPTADGQRMVIVMRELTANAVMAYTDYDPLRALSIMTEISEATGRDMDLSATVEAIITAVEPAIRFVAAELTLWYPETETLRPIGRNLVRTATGRLIPPEDVEGVTYRIGEGYTGWIAMYRQPLLINDIAGRTDVTPKRFEDAYQSYLGVPLMIDNEFVGTLELTHTDHNAFTQRDVSLLQAISGQIASAMLTARLYNEQTSRIAELDGLQQISEAMSQLGEAHELYAQLTARIAQLMDVDLCGVLLIDEAEQAFRSQLPFYGAADPLISDYRLQVAPDTELYHIWHHQPYWFTNDPDSSVVQAMGFDDLRSAIAINNLAMVPMIVGARRMGLLIVMNKHGIDGFHEDDMRRLLSYASQAAVVAENARLYADEQRRTRELGGLQQIAQAIGVLRSPAELYAQVTERIADLMDAQMCGVLLYDPLEHLLVSQQPFFGMEDPEQVHFYQLPSPPGSPVAALWLDRDTWYTNNLRRDPLAAETDLAVLAPQIGIRKTVIATLRVGGTRLGIIQAANKKDGSDFTDDDARVLSIFAGQAAVLIDNARLYREMQRRTHEAEGLRAITEISSVAVLDDEVVQRVLIAIANILETDIVTVGLVDENSGEMVVAPEYVWTNRPVENLEPFRFDAYAPGFEDSVFISRRPFRSFNLRADEKVLPQYSTLIKRLGMRNWLQVPLVIQDRSIGELTVANKVIGDFSDADEQLLMAIATQVTAMVDRQRLYQATDQDLRHRVQELNALSRVSHELGQTLELDRILDVIRQEALRSTDASAVSIVLLSEREDWVEEGQPEVEQRFGEGRALRAIAPVERAAIMRNDVIHVPNYNNSEFEARPQAARSALVVPINFGNQVAGVLHLFSDQADVFDQRVINFALSLTDQATVALGNARRYQDQVRVNEQLRTRAEQMGRIFALGEMFRRGASLEETLEEIAHGIQETIGFNVVLISISDEDAGVMRRTAQAGLPLAVFETLKETAPPIAQARGLMQTQFRIGNSYFLPAEGAAELTDELPTYQALSERMGRGPRSWDPNDLLLVPLRGGGGHLLGILSVDEPRNGRRPDLAVVEALEIFANQAAFSIENYRLVSRIREEAEATRRERDRLAQLHLVASQVQAAEDVPARLQIVADGIRDAGWNHVIITLRDQYLEPTALIQSGYTQDEAITLSDDVEPGVVWTAWINDLEFHEHKLGAGYYMRYNDPWVQEHILKNQEIDPPEVDDDVWHPQDILYYPLVGQQSQRIIGIISMDSPADGLVPTEAALQPFELFAAQAAAAIETTRLYQETVRAAEQEQRINEVMEAVSAAIRPSEVIEAVGRGLQQMVPFTRMSVALYDAEARHFDILRAEIALDGSVTVSADEPISLEVTALGMVYQSVKPQLYNLAEEEASRETLKDLREWYASGERSTLIVPMAAGGQVIGALHLGSELSNAFGFQEITELIQRLANLSAVSLENARLFQQARNRAAVLDAQAQRLGMINRISTRLVESLDPTEIYNIALAELQDALGAQFSGLVLFETATTGRLVAGTRKGDLEKARVEIDLRENRSIEYVKKHHKPLPSEDVLTDERFKPVWPTLKQRGTVSLVIVPLIVADEVIGTIGLDFTEPHTFTDAELELAETIASQVSVALEKANLLTQAEQRARELNQQAQRLAALNEMSARLAEQFDPDEIYATVLDAMQNALGMDYGGLMMIDQRAKESRLILSTHPADDKLPDIRVPLEGNPLAEAIIATHRPVVAGNIPEDPRFEGMHELQEARDTRAMMIIPLIVGDEVIGTIGLDSKMPREFTESEIELAMTAANQAAVAIEKSRLFSETQDRAVQLDAQARRMARVNQVSTQLAETLDMEQIFEIVLSELQDALDIDFAGLVMFEDETTGRLIKDTHPEDEGGEGVRTISLQGNRSIEIVRETRKPLASGDVLRDKRFEPAWDMLRERGTRALIIVPLVVGEEVIGTIGLDSTRRRKFTDAEIGLAETIAAQASLAIEKARLYNETLGLTIFNQAVVESIQQGIVVLDQDLHVRRINHFMSERYGWDSSAVGQPLFTYRPDYADFLREPMAVALGMGDPQVQYEVERQDESGQPSIRNYYVYPLREGPQVTGVVLLLEDVSERARLEADLEARAVQMAALTEVSGQITSTLEPDQVINVILDALGRVIRYDGVSLWLRSSDTDELVIAAARGYADEDATGVDELLGLTVDINYSPLFREMSEEGRVINVGDVSAGDPRFPYGSAAVYKNWLGAPLISRGQVAGVIALEKREPGYYNELAEQLALTFANQAAVALYNAQLFAETRMRAQALDEQAQRLALLNRVSLALAQTLDLENIFEIALREAAIALEIYEGAALQIDPASNTGRAIVDYPRGDAPPTLTFILDQNDVVDRVRNNLIPIVVQNTEGDPLANDLRALLRRDDVTQSLMVPLVVGGLVIGILRLDMLDPERDFTDEQIGLAQTIASQAGIAVQNAALFEQTSIRTRELETLFESAQATAVTLDLDEVVRRVTIQMLSALNTDACTIFLWDEVGGTLTVRGEISTRAEGDAAQLGDVVDLDTYPRRLEALRERTLLTVCATDANLPPGERELLERHEAATRVLIPLIVNDISIGLAEVELLDPTREFRPETERLARTLASQAAISIENARLQTETRRTVEELYVINDMSTSLSSADSLEELLDVIDMQLPNLTDAQWLYVVLYDAATQQLTFPLATDVLNDERHEMDPRPLGADEFSLVVRNRAPLLLAGRNIDEVRRSLGIQTLMADAHCFLGVPLFVADEVIGVLGVRDDEDPAAFTHNDQRILTTIGGQLGVALHGTRLFQQTVELAEDLDRRVQERTTELEQERQHISTLYDITTELAASLDMERLLERALTMTARAVGATQGAILAVEPITERLFFRARLGWDVPEAADEETPSLAMNEGLAGWAIQQRRSVVVEDVQNDPRWLRLSEADDQPRSAMVALIETNEDILGVMMIYSEMPGKFTEEQLRLVTAAASQVANAMNNAELYSLIRDQAERLGEMLRHEQVEATQSASILNAIADGVMVVNAEGQVIVFNTAAARILGVTADKILHRSTAEISGLYGGSTTWTAKVQQWMEDPTAYEPGEFHEERLRLEDGRVINVRLSPVNMGDQFLGMVSVFRDITREVEVDRLKSEFVATVSHELRTPMTSIKGYADLLLLGAAGGVTDQQQRFLETIKQNADRLSILVNDLLDISRIDQGRMDLKPAAVEVGDLINSVVLHLRGRCEDEARAMTVNATSPDDEHLTIWGDYDKVAQIMTNLADNAFNYTPEEGTITINAWYDDATTQMIISIADTGIGIPPEVADRVFERFFRGDEAQDMVMDTPGTGLGLAIVNELVRAHGGRIWFESEVNQGTTFFVSLPTKPWTAKQEDDNATAPEQVAEGDGTTA